MVRIDREKCIGCGKCRKDCFGRNIEWKDGKAQVIGDCFKCGHCVAVCPVEAVTITDYPAMDEFKGTSEIEPENLLHMMQFRRSIRNYKNKAVEQEKLDRVLAAGRCAPTAGNAQDVRYTVIRENLEELKPMVWEGLISIADCLAKEKPQNPYTRMWHRMYENYKQGIEDHMFFETPVLLIITADEPIDGALAAANIELMANAEGLGCLYSGFIQRGLQNNPQAAKFADVNPEKICICMLIGYSAINYKRPAPRKEVAVTWK